MRDFRDWMSDWRDGVILGKFLELWDWMSDWIESTILELRKVAKEMDG